MENISTYVSLVGSPYANKVLSDEYLDKILWEDTINGIGPGGVCDTKQEDIDEIISKLSGNTIKQYCEWRWPDNPEEQFLFVLQDICEIEKNKGDVYAVFDKTINSIMKPLTFSQAKTISSSSYNKFIIPIDALNKD